MLQIIKPLKKSFLSCKHFQRDHHIQTVAAMCSPSEFHLQMSRRRQLAVHTTIICVLQLLVMISQVEGIASPVRFQSVVDACSATRYPHECMSSLFSSKQADNQNFLSSVVSSAQGAVQDLYSFSSNIHVNPGSTREQDAVNTCLDTLQASKLQIDTTLAELAGGFTPQTFQSKMHDILTWLSASLTYHTTCTVDGWESGIGGSARDAIQARGVSSEKLLINAVAFAANVLGSFQDRESSNVAIHHRRRLKSADEFPSDSGSGSGSHINIGEEKALFEMDGEGYPHWLRGGVRRRLLQQNNHLTIYDAVVSQDGRGQFRTIQAAVDAAPQFNPKIHVIKINQGIYYERVTVPWNSSNIMFIGDGMYKTVISASRSVARDNTTTYWTATLAVEGRGFLARDLTFRNTAGAIGMQAVAVRVESDKSAFLRCSFEGYQDTLYAHTQRQFYKNCTFKGTIDYIFGNAAAVFQTCGFLMRKPLLGQFNTLTAQGRTLPEQNTGFSFQNCFIDAASDLKWALNNSQPFQSYLGRPWKLYSRTVILKSDITGVIDPAGWAPWNGTFALSTLFYGEFKNFGAGARFDRRVHWATLITDPAVATKFTVIFISGAEWLPQVKVDFQPQL